MVAAQSGGAMKRAHVDREYKWTPALAQKWRNVIRAGRRGRGPDKRADVLPLDILCDLPPESVEEYRTLAWPAAGLAVAIVVSAWATRELESGSALLEAVTLQAPRGDEGPCGVAFWNLPVSKADVAALGKVRCLACSCPNADCPVRAMHTVVEASRKAMHVNGACNPWPLIVKANGDPVSKADMASYYKGLASAAGLQDLWLPPHCARVTGAVRMALAGVSEWTIQVFCRWGSDTVLKYVREALLGTRGKKLHSAITSAAGRLWRSCERL